MTVPRSPLVAIAANLVERLTSVASSAPITVGIAADTRSATVPTLAEFYEDYPLFEIGGGWA